MSIRNQINTIFDNFARDVEQINNSKDADLSPEALEAVQASRHKRILDQTSQRLEQAVAAARGQVSMAEARNQRPAVDWKDPGSVAAAQSKWKTVELLLQAGKSWQQIIADADAHTLAAINTFAADHLEVEAVKNGTNAQALLEPIEQASDQRAAKLSGVGLSGMGYYMEHKANLSWAETMAEQFTKYAATAGEVQAAQALVDMWQSKADYVAAKVQGVPTPNERAVAEHQQRLADEWAQEQPQYAPGESPDELAAQVPRSY